MASRSIDYVKFDSPQRAWSVPQGEGGCATRSTVFDKQK